MSGGLLFQRQPAGIVKLSEAVMVRMQSFRQTHARSTEAGGVLLGRRIVDALDVIVDEVTTPTAGDVRRRYEFLRCRPAHQAIIDQRWEDSGGSCQYLGEWHTHPEPRPSPSAVDLGEWWRRVVMDAYLGPGLFYCIIGTEEVGMWEVALEEHRIERLTPPRG